MASLTEGSHLPLWAFVGFVLAVCFVSGIIGDVPDGVVYTDLHKTVQLGDRAVLKCQFYGTPLAVFWKKGNDPRTAPNLITRIQGEHDLGFCVQDKTCEMNDDYSLTIKNVTIADQGRYICRVSNYMGILIHGYTDFKVYATPEEPYPFIKECNENGKNCTVSAQDPLNITCTASRYFPIIDLLFLNGGQKVSTIETVEWENDDGTKSKLIFTRVPPSKIPYVCMAFNIPGSQDERTSTISVFDHHANTTFGEPAETDLTRIFKIVTPKEPYPFIDVPGSQDNRTATVSVFHLHGNTTVGPAEPTESGPNLVIKIALPVGVSVVGVSGLIVLVKIFYMKCRKIETDGTRDETKPLLANTGRISYYELWFLAGKMTESEADNRKLRDTFQELKITTDIKDRQLTQLEAYQALYNWKQKNREGDQAKHLKEALRNFHHDDIWKTMLDEKRSTKRKVSQDTMKHILWEIGGIEKVNQFLSKLIRDWKPIDANAKMMGAITTSLRELSAWSNKHLQLNPFVLISLALEEAGCTFFERLLFSVPDKMKAPIQDEKLKEFTDKLTGRHCKRLAVISNIGIIQKITGFQIAGNNHYVFDTRSLITDWLGEVECSNYEKRCRLDDAVIKIGRYDLQDFFKTIVDRPNAEEPRVKFHHFDHESIFDDDITQLMKLVKWLPPDKKTQLKQKIELPGEEHGNDDTLKDQIKAWRDRITATGTDKKMSKDEALKEFQSFRKELINNTKYTELTLTDEEIEAVSSHVTSPDKQQKLTSRLHIKAVHGQNDSFIGQLKQWRNTQAKENCRDTLQKALRQSGLEESIVSKRTTKQLDQEELPRIALDLMMEDVCPIIDALGMDQKKVQTYVHSFDNRGNSTKSLLEELKKKCHTREEFCKALRNMGFIDIAKSVYFGKISKNVL